MKKVVICIVAVLVVCAAVVGVVLFQHRGGDIIGVTSYADKNTVIMNSKEGNEFVSGTGSITVKEGEGIHLDYKLKSGSFDIHFTPGKDAVQEAVESDKLEDLPEPEEPDLDGAVGQTGVEGSGDLDFDVEPGEYTVIFNMNGAIGKATVTAKKN